MADGVHESLAHRAKDYEEYLKRIEENAISKKYGECNVAVFDSHTHQATMTACVLKAAVKTPLIMFCEHDTSPIGDIPFNYICEIVRTKADINYIRFNIFEKIPAEHEYLMLGVSREAVLFYQGETQHSVITIPTGFPLRHTIQWSQRPHIAKTNWYKDILYTYFPKGKRTMIEDVMHGVVISAYEELGFDKFGLYIYTPEGNQLRSYHSDGRQSDEKIIEA